MLPLRVVRDRNRGGALLAMVFNGLSTVGLMLILTYQLQTVLHYSPLRTGLTLVPFALAAACGSVLIARRLMTRVAPAMVDQRRPGAQRGRAAAAARPHAEQPLPAR